MDLNIVRDLVELAYLEGVVDSTVNTITGQTCAGRDLYEESDTKKSVDKIIAHEKRMEEIGNERLD